MWAAAVCAAVATRLTNVQAEPFTPPELPAVTAINGKLDSEHGGIGGEPLAAAAGSLSVPFAERFAAQFDGLAGRWNNGALDGAALHLFWRDPTQALLGIYASSLHWSGSGSMEASRAGLEAEYYLDRVTLEGFAGGEFGDITSRGSGRFRLDWYPRDDLEFSIGGEYLGGEAGLLLGSEWQLPTQFPSQAMYPALFVQARISDRDHSAVWGGLRFYFGAAKGLIERHRQDDPQNNLTDDAALYGGSSNSTGGSGSAPPPPPPPPPPCCLQ
jgi:hypothetical protein